RRTTFRRDWTSDWCSSDLLQVAEARRDKMVVTADPFRQNHQQVLRELVRRVNHVPQDRLVNDEQVSRLGSHDIGRRIAIFVDRHFSGAGPGCHGDEYRRIGRTDMHVEASREHHEDELVLRTRRKQQFSRLDVATVAPLQQVLHVLRAYAAEQVEPGQERPLVIRINAKYLTCHEVILSVGSIYVIAGPMTTNCGTTFR